MSDRLREGSYYTGESRPLRFSEELGIVWENITSPSAWPMRWRHVFVLGLPVTFPLWLVALVVLTIGYLLCILIGYPLIGLIDIWDGKPRR